MKKNFLIIILILIVITLIAIYAVNNYRTKVMEAQKLNNEYNAYYNIEILGTELISIINKTIDTNNKNEIARDENNYFVDNGENSIEIYIQFVYKDKTKTIKMEDIEKGSTEAFIQRYSTANFKCTNIEYHSKTKNVKSLTFEEVLENK